MSGIERDSFARRFGYTIDELAGETIDKLAEIGLLVDGDQRLRLSREGLFLSDGIFGQLLRK